MAKFKFEFSSDVSQDHAVLSLFGSIFDLRSISANIDDADSLALAESEPRALVCETPMVAMSIAKNTRILQ